MLKERRRKKGSGVFLHFPPQQDFTSKRKERQWKKKRHKEAIDFLDSVDAVLFCGLLPLASVLFGTLWVILEEQAEGGEAKQKRLDKPQAASGRAVDTFVTVGPQKRNNVNNKSQASSCFIVSKQGCSSP